MAPRPRRRGLHELELAVVIPLVFLLLFGLLFGCLGALRYREVASLADEGARYAAGHGRDYQKITGHPAATATDVFNNAVSADAVLLNPSQLSSTVTWSPDNDQGSTVTVTVTYHWVPEAYLGGLTLRSTSTATIRY
jgi:Flp pilus assembly protein TadG